MIPDRETLASPRLGLAFASMLLVSGIANTFPVFLPPLLEEFGGSRGATASAASLLWLGGAILGPLAGYLVSHWNPRAVVMVGLGAAAAGLALATLAPSLPLFLAAVAMGGGIGVGLTGMVPQAALIADTYVRRRGLAMGIAFSGSMAGYALALPAQSAIIYWGWRGAFWGYVAAICALIPWAWSILPTRLHARVAGGALRAGDGGRSVGSIVASPPFWSLFVLFGSPPLFAYLATTRYRIPRDSLASASPSGPTASAASGGPPAPSARGRSAAGP